MECTPTSPKTSSPPSPPPESTTPPATTELASFDLETYISRYDAESETRLQRLLFIANKSPSDEISKLAFELAERQMKAVGNVKRYREVFGPTATTSSSSPPEATNTEQQRHQQHGSGTSGDTSGGGEGNPSQPLYQKKPPRSILYDDEWVQNTEHASQSQLETLEARLQSALAHLAKEAIRSAYVSLSQFYKRHGDLREAMRCLLRSREFCTTNKQIALVCLDVIEVGIDCQNYNHVNAYITKAEHTSDLLSSGPPLTSAKLQCASGLLFLNEGRYAMAAKKLAAVSVFDLQFNRVISPEDICLYASLCGLASLERPQLRRLVLDSQSFQQRLELVPWMRDALRHFSRAEYGPCLDLLSRHNAELKLDIHLSPHVDALYAKVLDRCIITYFFPYKSVCLEKMSGAFSMTREEMEGVLERLILDGRIKGGARIDARRGILTTRDGRQRNVMKKVLKFGDGFVSQTESMILRLSCLEHDLVVQNDHPRGGGGGGGGSGVYDVVGTAGAGGRFGARQRVEAFEDYSSDEDFEGVVGEDEEAMMMDVDAGPEYTGAM